MTCNHNHEHADCIVNVPIFSNLTCEESLEVALITSAKIMDKNEFVYMAGDQGGKMFVIHKGSVKVFRINPNGKEQVIRIAGPGDFLGELSLFASSPHTDNAQVLEKCTMCIVDGEKLKELMGKYSSIAFKVMSELSKRLEKAENLIEEISLTDVEQRLARALLSQADDKGKIVLNMTKGDFASSLAMSQETLSRKLTAFQSQGLIKLQGHKTIYILDKEALEEETLL